ncbi:MAG TPA: cation-transporting P-type ATPase, partial [bacterium]
MESPKTFAVQFKGLEPSEASRRLKTFGPNRLTPPSLSRGFLGVLRTLADPMSLMLLLASAVYFFMGDSRNGLILAVAVAPVLLVDVLLEARSKNALKKLAQAVAPNSRVIRGGQEIEIPTEELVPGDLLLLREGDSAHSDGIILQAAHLGMDESSLTGESDLKLKEPLTVVPGVKGDESNQFYAGSIARSGHGLGQVTVTGSRTRFGQIAILASEEKPHQTPLQKKIGRLVKLLVVGSIFAVAGIFGLVFWRTGDLERSFLSGVSLAISAIPEEFPLVFTLFLSLGAWRLSLKGVLIRRLSSVETLGSTTVLCVDKTGTLTEGEFHLESHQSLDGTLSELEILEASVLACELSPADPMEKAVWRHAVEHGLDVSTLEKKWQLVFDYDFDPAGKHMSHVWKKEKEGKTEWRIVAKGALEGVLEHCAVTLEERKTIEEANRLLAAQGMRILVLAGRWATSFIGDRLQDERDLKIYGLLGFKDPLRSDVPEAVAQCQKAGIKIKLLTGDHLLTAHAVADTAGVAHESDGILNGPELFQLPKASFEEKVRKGSIFGRVQPEQKYAIVEALQKAGEIVAMTGDGVNDAPALRKADIGISMGKKATEVARASA